jgi:Amidohydrolase family
VSHDLVLAGGRVVDPETGFDRVCDVGIDGDSVAAVGYRLDGATTVDVGGLVVAPGFVDLHSHAQTLPGRRLQACDGVTTALDLEDGRAPVEIAYAREAKRGSPINYGFSASWAAARMHVVADRLLDGGAAAIFGGLAGTEWQRAATAAQVARILDQVSTDLAAGAVGVGVLIGYAPGVDPAEYLAVAELAAAAGGSSPRARVATSAWCWWPTRSSSRSATTCATSVPSGWGPTWCSLASRVHAGAARCRRKASMRSSPALADTPGSSTAPVTSSATPASPGYGRRVWLWTPCRPRPGTARSSRPGLPAPHQRLADPGVSAGGGADRRFPRGRADRHAGGDSMTALAAAVEVWEPKAGLAARVGRAGVPDAATSGHHASLTHPAHDLPRSSQRRRRGPDPASVRPLAAEYHDHDDRR